MAEKKKRRRRSPNEGSVYQRADGLWVAALWLGYDETGKPKRRVRYAQTKAGALAKLGEDKRKLAEYGAIPTASMTVKEWLTYWLDNIIRPRVDPASARTYRTAVEQYLIPSIGRHRLDKLGPQHVRQMHTYVLSLTRTAGRGKDKRQVPLSVATARSAHGILRIAMRDAEREGRILRNVVTFVDPPKGRVEARDALTAEQARTLLRAVLDDRLGSRWAAAILEGIRQGEALGLQWDRVDLDNGILDVSWQLKVIGYRHTCGAQHTDGTWPCGAVRPASCPKAVLDVPPGYLYKQLHGRLCLAKPKSSTSERVLPMPPSLVASLRHRHQLYEVERADYTTDHGLVWCHPDGRPIDRRQDYQEWKDLLSATGLPDVELHAARHTTATLLMEAGTDPQVIKAILGHAGVVTQQAYKHVDRRLATEAIVGLGDMLAIDR